MKKLEEILKEREKVANSIVTYMDEKGDIVEKDKATKCIICEYDKDGNIINEVFGNCNSTKERKEEER